MSDTEHYQPKEITNKKRTISSMKKNKKKRDKSKQSIFPLKGIYLVSQIIKRQNLKLLEAIAEEYINSEEEQESFIQLYSKSNYYIPDISDDPEEEKTQQILLKTMLAQKK
tara:strand:- start:81 stop:413 length:333 start_codon:yes stop_codon:yes gene_type:complete